MTDPKDQNQAASEDDVATPNDVSADHVSADIDAGEETAGETSPEDSEQDDSASSESADNSDGNAPNEDSDSTDNTSDSDADDDLPDWEPLTPELVEDEAIRGDFMLRWAVVLLAFLLGCRQISETVTLVRVRTGEYLASNGVLPPANDVFSYTAAERPWVNLGWLFDLLVAGLHSAGGATALTLFSALVAGATFYLIHGISRRETPTWWISICACVALLMVNLQFTAMPQLVTLLGTAWMLHRLHSWSQTGKQSTLWCLVVSLAVWSNLDPRAFIGWIILLAYLAGTALARKSGRGGHHAEASLKDLSMATAAGFVALMVHPFGWHAIISPVQLYGVELPALADYAGRIRLPDEIQYVSLLNEAVWTHLNQYTIAALVMAAIAIATSVVNASRLDAGLVTVFAAMLLLSLLSWHELGAMTLVACVVAALNGQDWYRANCRQEYTINTLEVLWSRAGRAITVIGFAAIAFFAISGRLMGPDGRRVGLGFSPWFTAAIEATKNELDALPEGRIFTFRLDQSDLLLWHGVPTFADSRVGVFAGGKEDILRIHNQARHALRRGPAAMPTPDQSAADSTADRTAAENSAGDSATESENSNHETSIAPASEQSGWGGKRDLWEVPFKRFQVELVTPRMWGATPDYSSYFDLLRNSEWELIKLGATTAFFVRSTSTNTPSVPGSDLFRNVAFDDCRANSEVEPRLEWPRPVSAYQQFLSLPEQPSSNFSQRAQHEFVQLSAGINGAIPMTRDNALGLAVLALRDAVAGASREPDNWRIYGVQSDIQQIIARIEAITLAQFQLPLPTQHRHYQRLFALHQALTIDPGRLEILSNLADHYIASGHTDFAFDMVERAQSILTGLPDSAFSDDELLQRVGRINQLKQELQPRVEETEKRINEAMLEGKFDRIQMAVALRQGGFPGHALAILEEDRVAIADNPAAQLQLAELLLEAGRLEEASTMFATLESMGSSATLPISVIMHASWLDQGLGNYMGVERRCVERLEQLQKASTQAMLGTLPMSMPTPQFLGESNIWPATQTLVASRTLTQTASEIALLQWTIAMARIEAGECEEAAITLKELVDAFPESQFRPLVKIWLQAMTGEEISDTPPEPESGILFNDDSDMVGWMNSSEDPAQAEDSASPEGDTTPGKPESGSTDE